MHLALEGNNSLQIMKSRLASNFSKQKLLDNGEKKNNLSVWSLSTAAITL